MELVIRNRRLMEGDLTTIRGLIQAEGPQGRTHLSRRLCRLWEWRQPNGAYREMACRDLLRQLEKRNLIQLPVASFLLGRICRRLAQDWWSVYQESIVLAETFVDAQRLRGACYRAANWLGLGPSRGRGRNVSTQQIIASVAILLSN